MTPSVRYTIRRLWGVAPVLTTNLLEAGLVDRAFNESLTRSAVEAFDGYVSSHRRRGSLDRPPPAVESRRRRRREVPPPRRGRGSSEPAEATASAGDPGGGDGPTGNDRFFEHQRTRGYRLATEPIATCGCARQLQEELVVDAAVFYLREGVGAQGPADRLLLGDAAAGGGLSVDLWASVQRGRGARHGYHVHEGALVSGVYYAAAPPGSAPLILRRPEEAGGVDDGGDVVVHPSEGQLILFPPWVEHGVPPSEDENHTGSNLPRVSFALNVTGKFAFGNPWDVTRGVDHGDIVHRP